MYRALQLHPSDNVAVVITECNPPGKVSVTSSSRGEAFEIEALEKIPFGHKIALRDLAKGDLILKYGRPIGRATANIAKGGVVGVHNIEGLRGRGDLGRQEVDDHRISGIRASE